MRNNPPGRSKSFRPSTDPPQARLWIGGPGQVIISPITLTLLYTSIETSHFKAILFFNHGSIKKTDRYVSYLCNSDLVQTLPSLQRSVPPTLTNIAEFSPPSHPLIVTRPVEHKSYFITVLSHSFCCTFFATALSTMN